jgi:hypothetical protein
VHTLSSLLLRTSVSSRAVLDGGLGMVVDVAHLPPFHVAAAVATQTQEQQEQQGQSEVQAGAQAQAQAQRQQEGGGGGESSPHARAPQPQQQQHAAAAAAAAAAAPPLQRVGDGVVAVTSSTGVHVVLVRPWGDLVHLHSVPRADGARAGALPTAAWMPHGRRGGGEAGGGLRV